jgi:hypothetical protein
MVEVAPRHLLDRRRLRQHVGERLAQGVAARQAGATGGRGDGRRPLAARDHVDPGVGGADVFVDQALDRRHGNGLLRVDLGHQVKRAGLDRLQVLDRRAVALGFFRVGGEDV